MQRSAVMAMAVCLLGSVLLTVVVIARYEALRTDIRNACPSAAALDLTEWIPLCKAVQFQQMIMPEDWERPK